MFIVLVYYNHLFVASTKALTPEMCNCFHFVTLRKQYFLASNEGLHFQSFA